MLMMSGFQHEHPLSEAIGVSANLRGCSVNVKNHTSAQVWSRPKEMAGLLSYLRAHFPC